MRQRQLLLGVLAGISLLTLWQVGSFFLVREVTTSVTISPEQSVLISLRQAQLVHSPLLTGFLLRRADVAPGVYTITGRYSDRTLIAYLSDPAHSEVVVTIPEGWRIEQMALRLERLEVVSAKAFISAATMRDRYRDDLPKGMELAAGTRLEGLLFPETYRFIRPTKAEEVVSRLLRQFTSVTFEQSPSYQQVILASLVEREAKQLTERPVIAGVFANRLAAGRRLDADPSVAYGRDTARIKTLPPEDWEFWSAVTPADLTLDHRFNTYRSAGLPPTPIASPGLESLAAAHRPAEHNYFYFFHDRAGTFQPSNSFDEHRRKLQGR